MIFGYARCSTDETKQDIERQIVDLKARGAEIVYSEYISGTISTRPELKKLLRRMRDGDTLVTCEVSRLTRSVRMMCDIIDTAKRKRLILIFGGYRVDCSGEVEPMQEGMLKMAAVFAEIERNLIVGRVKSGIENAKAKGVKLGRPKLEPKDIPADVMERFGTFKNGGITKTDFAKVCGISRPTLDKYLNLINSIS